MKISSSSTLDFNTNEGTAGCLSSLLRRLLCGNFHHSALNSSEVFSTDIKQEVKKPPPSPGLVARLMGLDSMPVYPCTPTESIVRSRSTNSTEGWNGFLSGQKNWATKHRTSQSFREEPTFLRKENEDFLILSFTPDEQGKEFSSNGVKPKIDFGELNELRSERAVEKKNRRRIEKQIEGKENVRGKRQSHGEDKNSKPLQKKELYRKVQAGENNESSNKAKKQRKESRRVISSNKRSVSVLKKLEPECSSQNSSPVSVLDRHLDNDGEYLTSSDSPISEEDKKPKQEKPRRNPSSELKSDSYPSLKTELIRNSKDEGLKSANVDSKRGKSSERKKTRFFRYMGPNLSARRR